MFPQAQYTPQQVLSSAAFIAARQFPMSVRLKIDSLHDRTTAYEKKIRFFAQGIEVESRQWLIGSRPIDRNQRANGEYLFVFPFDWQAFRGWRNGQKSESIRTTGEINEALYDNSALANTIVASDKEGRFYWPQNALDPYRSDYFKNRLLSSLREFAPPNRHAQPGFEHLISYDANAGKLIGNAAAHLIKFMAYRKPN